MHIKAAESPPSAARFVGQTRFYETRQLKTRTAANWLTFTHNFIFGNDDLAETITAEIENAKA